MSDADLTSAVTEFLKNSDAFKDDVAARVDDKVALLTKNTIRRGDIVQLKNKGTAICLEDPKGTHIPALIKCRGGNDAAEVQAWIKTKHPFRQDR